MPNNNTENLLTDDTILMKLGEKIRQVRLRKDMTQIALAEESGVAKRTIERFEKGASIQLTGLVRILRALGMIELLLDLIPEQENSPMAQLLGEKKVKYRASRKDKNKDKSPTQPDETSSKWEWGEE